jgi:hypothetical protein
VSTPGMMTNSASCQVREAYLLLAKNPQSHAPIALFSLLSSVYTLADHRPSRRQDAGPAAEGCHMATAPSPNDLTRQQLDELDALLQRMLSLPLNPPDAVPSPAQSSPFPETPAAKNWRIDPPTPAPIPTPHLIAAPVPVELPVPPRPAEIYVPPEPPAQAAPTAHVPRPEPVRPPEPAPLPPVRTVAAAPPRVTAPAPPPKPPEAPGPVDVMVPPPPLREAVAFPLWPLVGLNWLADTLLGALGPPGRVLRSGFGKNLLGFIGIGLLLYTAAHVAQQQGLLSLPIPLPWPQ